MIQDEHPIDFRCWEEGFNNVTAPGGPAAFSGPVGGANATRSFGLKPSPGEQGSEKAAMKV